MKTLNERYRELENEVRIARTRRKNAAEALAQFLGVPVAIDGWWRFTVLIDGEQVPIKDLIPINPVLEKRHDT